MRQLVFGSMVEPVSRPPRDRSLSQHVGQIAIPGNLSEADDHPHLRERIKFRSQVSSASSNLLGGGFVGGRRAANHGRDIGMAQPQAILAMRCRWLRREAERVQHRVHEIAGAVSRKGASGTIRSVGAGCQSQNENPGTGVAETGYWPRPVSLIPVGTASRLPDCGAVAAKSRAELAGDNLVLNLDQQVFHSGWGKTRHTFNDRTRRAIPISDPLESIWHLRGTAVPTMRWSKIGRVRRPSRRCRMPRPRFEGKTFWTKNVSKTSTCACSRVAYPVSGTDCSPAGSHGRRGCR